MSSIRIARRRATRLAALAAILGVASPASRAAEAPAIAVVSLVGDVVDVVTHRAQTGSRLDANAHQSIDFSQARLDDTALQAAGAALVKAEPGASVFGLARNSPAVYAAAKDLIDGEHVRLPAPLAADVAREHATQVLLITKRRAVAAMQLDQGTTGSGQVEGLGFYLDYDKRLKRSDTGEPARGFLAPFCYLDVTLVDVAGGRILGRASVGETHALSAARSPDADPWNALDAQHKIEALRELLRDGIEEAIPRVLGRVAAPAPAASGADRP